MIFLKNIKDIMYALLQEPTVENFREFMRTQTGEHNSIDFKEKWIEKDKLAKEILAIANSGGGVIVFGVKENSDNSLESVGLIDLKDKADASKEIRGYISSDLKYEIYDFVFETSEYQNLNGKKFQMIAIEDTPQFIPFLARRESGTLKQNMIYIRRGTSCEIANEEELQKILKKRVNYIHPNNGVPLQLDEHLSQLSVLYKNIEKDHTYYKNRLFSSIMSSLPNFAKGEKIIEPNPWYPDESYEEFVSRMIDKKKKKIERVLDLY